MRVTPHHHPIHSDLPLQMPNLTDRAGEKMRPSIYGGVMSGPGAQATTAPVTLLGDKLPSTARNAGQNSSRPPTYQSTQSASKRSGSNLGANTTSFNPLPQHHYNSRPPVQPYVYSQEAGSNQYMTANFPDEPSNRESTSHLRHEKEPDLVSKGQYTNTASDAAADRPLMINETSTVNTMRNTRVNTHRSNSMSNLHSLPGVGYFNNNGNGAGYN